MGVQVQTAFLNADVEEEVYVKMAHDYETTDKAGVPLVMKLRKLFDEAGGSKSAELVGNHRLVSGGSGIRVSHIYGNTCAYTYNGGDTVVLLKFFSDNVLLLGKNIPEPEVSKKELISRFEMMTNVGNLSLTLGRQVTRDREKRTLTISQQNYTQSVTGEVRHR